MKALPGNRRRPGGQQPLSGSGVVTPLRKKGSSRSAPGPAGVQAARDVAADATGRVAIAQAVLQEALAAVPVPSPRVAAARDSLRAASAAADAAAVRVAARTRAAQDTAGDVDAAAAVVADFATGARTPTAPAQLVRARTRLGKVERALGSAEEAVRVAQEDRQHAENAVGVAEEVFETARRVVEGEPATVIRAREQLAQAQRAQDRAYEQLAEAEAEADRQASVAAGDTPAAQVPPLFGSVDVFVEELVLKVWVRPIGGRSPARWCAQWWCHAEAILRLEALWEAYEVMRREPAPSLSTWLWDHFDHHMRVLTDQDGPFWECTEDHHEKHTPWEADAPADDLFPVCEQSRIKPARANQGVSA